MKGKAKQSRSRIDPEKVRAMAAKGLSDPQIAAELGDTKSTVGSLRRRLGIPAALARGQRTAAGIASAVRLRRSRRAYSRNDIAQLVANGSTNAEIAASLGVCETTARKARVEFGIPINLSAIRSEGNRKGLRRRASAFGLPQWCHSFQIRVLIALATGPKTAAQIVEVIGSRTRLSPGQFLHALTNHSGQKLFSQLVSRGLVLASGRSNRPRLYSLTALAYELLSQAPGATPDEDASPEAREPHPHRETPARRAGHSPGKRAGHAR